MTSAMNRPRSTGPKPVHKTPPPAAAPLREAELAELEALLDSLPPGREPLDIVMLDGYLCGVLLQPRRVPEASWLARITDLDGKSPPPGFDTARLAALAGRRHAELNRAIERRDWFDPWVYELDDEASPSETVLPWVAGFGAALEVFPALLDEHEDALTEPLATLYRHFEPEDLDDVSVALQAEIDTLELPATLAEAVEDLVRSVLLIADVTRPVTPARAGRRPGAHAHPGPGRRSRNGRRASPARPGSARRCVRQAA